MGNDYINKVILVTGGFDPIHSGHIRYFKAAKQKCDFLVVGLNSDEWLKRKKKLFFLPFEERLEILESFSFVDKVISFNDDDDSAIYAIKQCLNFSKEVIFANGGDRIKDNIPEFNFFKEKNNVTFLFDIGGNEKVNSSSWILKNYIKKYLSLNSLDDNFEKPWGGFQILVSGKGYKVKSIEVNPGMRLSLQSHKYRNEHWVITEGLGELTLGDSTKKVKTGDYIFIPIDKKHRIYNTGHDTLRFIEIAYGDYVEESDIVRFEDDYGRS
tara:strand:- start:1723 stop:2529 length:807 start_codon:yes stop_codon:yes gene_type:complete